MKLKLGTRGSDLARAQSGGIARALETHGCEVELVLISTAGDRSQAPSFGSIGPQGVFVREIEQALLDGDVDLAVHSFKDLPTRSPDGLVVAAVPERHDPADCLVAAKHALDPSSGALLPLAPKARVGTASARRRVWLEHFRDDLDVASLRGNVPTRIKRLRAGDFDAILLAAAGVERLLTATDALTGLLEDLELVRLDPAAFVAAPAQGALAVQCRADADPVREVLGALDDAPTRAAIEAERDALARAEGGCDAAFGAYCSRSGAGFALAVMAEIDGRVVSATVEGATPKNLGEAAWSAVSRKSAASA